MGYIDYSHKSLVPLRKKDPAELFKHKNEPVSEDCRDYILIVCHSQ